MSTDRLTQRLERERARVQVLEGLIEERSRSLYEIRTRLEETTNFLRSVLRAIPNALLVLDSTGRVVDSNQTSRELLEYDEEAIKDRCLPELIRFSYDDAVDPTDLLLAKGVEASLVSRSGELIPVLYYGSRLRDVDSRDGFVCVATDLRERHKLESELRQAQKLEAVGQLASGIAHEINTPIQFVGDSIQFLAEAFQDLERVRAQSDRLMATFAQDPAQCGDRARLEATKDEIDLDFLIEEIPAAIERSQEGVRRVSKIIKAMKPFAHPGGREKDLADVNEALEMTLTVARSEYKYVAEVRCELGDVPAIPCHIGDLSQAFLNLVINAAHAIEEARQGQGLGLIEVSSRVGEDHVIVEIADDGAGMTDEVRKRIFDPFFTTKPVGRGTGQGLAITRNVIVEGHGGEIRVESAPGQGTRFTLLLPMSPLVEAR